MSVPTKPQIIYQNGQPAFAVIPYEDYKLMCQEQRHEGDYIPQAVVDLMFENDWPLLKAWRIYRGMSQQELADVTGMKQPTIARLENSESRMRLSTREKLAPALNIHPNQLILDEESV